MKVSGTFVFFFAASASLVGALPAPAAGASRVFPFNIAERDSGVSMYPRASNVTARATNSTDAASGGIGKTIQGLIDGGNGGNGGALDFLNGLVGRSEKRTGKAPESFKPQRRVDKSDHAARSFHNGIGYEGLVPRNSSST